MDNQAKNESNDAIMCPDWGKGSVLEDIAREFYERLGRISMCSQGRMFFNVAMGLQSEYAEEIGALESKEMRTEAEQTRLEILKARTYFAHDVALCVNEEDFFFSMATPEILHLPEGSMDLTEEWLIGTIFGEIGAAHACGLIRAIGSTVPEGPGWKLLGDMNGLQRAAYCVYDMYHEAVEASKRMKNFTDRDIHQIRILIARCSLTKSFFFTCLREEVARKDPGSEGLTFAAGGKIYACGNHKEIIDRMRGKTE